MLSNSDGCIKPKRQARDLAAKLSPRWQNEFNKAAASFRVRFWNGPRNCLFDVIDCEHIAGRTDSTVRPNQIFAVGGLPLNLLPRAMAVQVVAKVEARLLTPLGLRTLAPDDPGYVPHYLDGVHDRDSCYHQGTAWPWLMGAFAEAWVRVRGNSNEAKAEAREKFLGPLLSHLAEAGLGHVSEIADADSPHTPRGCPFQAWSIGELLRLEKSVMVQNSERVRRRKRRARKSMAALA